MKSNEDIEEAVVTVHKMTEEEKKRRIEDLKEKARLDEKAIWRKGYQDGYKDGLAMAKKEKIKRMKSLNMSDEDICKFLDITKEELAKLEL